MLPKEAWQPNRNWIGGDVTGVDRALKRDKNAVAGRPHFGQGPAGTVLLVTPQEVILQQNSLQRAALRVTIPGRFRPNWIDQ